MDMATYFIFLICLYGTASGYAYEDMDNLLRYLFNETRYNKHVRPVRNQSVPIKVNVSQMITSIESLNLLTGDLLTISAIFLSWHDELLTWTPDEYSDIDQIAVPTGYSWTPEITQINGPSNGDASINNMDLQPMWVSFDGFVLQIIAGYIQTKCEVDSRFYPFDTHTCSLGYICQKNFPTQVLLQASQNYNVISVMQPSKEWILDNIDSKSEILGEPTFGISVSSVLVTFDLTRRPAFELINYLSPLGLISVLNVATCLVPPDCGERLSFSVTLYLSFMFIVAAGMSDIPRDAVNTPLISYSYLTVSAINTIIIIWGIFIVRISRRSTQDCNVPETLKKIVLKSKLQKQNKVTPSALDTIDCIQKTINTGSNCDEPYNDKDDNTEDVPWLQVAKALDKIFLVTVCVIYVTAAIVYSYMYASAIYNK